VVDVLGPTGTTARGGTVTFKMRDCAGRQVDDRRVEDLANQMNISLRTGCFCNPGAGEVAHNLGAREMKKWFEGDEPVSFLDLRNTMYRDHDLLVGAIRISVGLATSFADVYRFACFMQRFADRTVDEIAREEFAFGRTRAVRDAAWPNSRKEVTAS
jgi:selenocysteine lyase/cysteine desulfurase